MTAKLTPERIAELRAVHYEYAEERWQQLLDHADALAAENARLRDALREIVRESEAGYNHASLLPEIARRALDDAKGNE
jgi:hypothetical protein